MPNVPAVPINRLNFWYWNCIFLLWFHISLLLSSSVPPCYTLCKQLGILKRKNKIWSSVKVFVEWKPIFLPTVRCFSCHISWDMSVVWMVLLHLHSGWHLVSISLCGTQLYHWFVQHLKQLMILILTPIGMSSKMYTKNVHAD